MRNNSGLSVAGGNGGGGGGGRGRRGHRRRNIRDPAATARALRGALLKALLAPGRCPASANGCITAWRHVPRARFRQKCARRSVTTCFSSTFLAIVRAFRLPVPSSAHDSDKNARVGVSRPAFRARFWQKCARFGSPSPHPRAIQAKMRAFRLLAPSSAHDSDNSAHGGARNTAIRGRL